MYILVKNLNGRLIFIMDNEVDFEVLLNELKGLLVQSFFKKKDYYPKAFFDLKGRILENDEILQFFGVLVECKSLLFGGFIEEKTEEKKELRMIGASIHARVLQIPVATALTPAHTRSLPYSPNWACPFILICVIYLLFLFI
jgi:septum site-determining protein MinC